MDSDQQAIGDRWIFLRERSGGTATPVVQWTVSGQRSPREIKGVYDVLGGGDGALAPVSARKLAAALWRLVFSSGNGSGSGTWRHALVGRLFELFSSSSIPKSVMEEATKWDYYYTNALDDGNYILSCTRHAALSQTEKCIDDIKSEGGSRRRNDYRMNKIKELDRVSRGRTEHQKLRLIVKNLADNIIRQRRKCARLDVLNSKLQSDIDGTKLSGRKFLQDLEKEKKARELLENKCDELAKYVDGCRAETGVLRNERARIHEEIKQESKMLQISEVWREERVQMELVDAKSMLVDKLAKINNLIMDCEAIMRPSHSSTPVNLTSEVKGRRVAGHGFGHDRKHCCPSSVRCINPHEVSDATRKSVLSNRLTSNQNGSEDTRSGKETVTQAVSNASERLGDCSDASGNRKKAPGGSTSLQSSEITSVSFVQSTNKGSSVCKPRNEVSRKTILINDSARRSNSSTSSTKHQLSPQRVLHKGYNKNHVLSCRKGSTEWGNLHVVEARKGHAISPKGLIQRNGSGSNLSKGKLRVRDVLEQRD